MMPIFEAGKGKGIGHSFDTFLRRFIEICEDHLKNGRAKAFAFILYDFHDETIRNILKNQGGFARLDRLSGHELSVFYLDSVNKHQIRSFNEIFLKLFDIPAYKKTPIVFFFKIVDGDAREIEIIELEQDNLLFAFEELYSVIESYVKKLKKEEVDEKKENSFIRFFKSFKKIAVDKIIEHVVTKAIEFGGRQIP